MSKDIENLIVKFLLKEANFDELQQLELWITNPKNEILFLEYIKTNAFINKVMNQYNKDKAKENIIRRIRKEKKYALVYKKPWFKYAAAILVVALASTYFLRNTLFNNQIEYTAPVIVNNQIEPGIDKATLTLETGETIALEKGTAIQTQNASSNGEEIVYDAKNKTAEIAYNTLTIPRGGQFQLTLADGTKVWLNSETKLKYPVAFTDGESRLVELVYGEAYFEVSPSTEHKGSDFKVFNNQQEVQVLGTEFNIKAYKDETQVYTTLAEGSVAINYAGKTQRLSPGKQSILNSNTNTLTVGNVNVKIETAWKEGNFNFIEGKSLKEIMKVLSRWYDFEVVFENKSLEDVRFKGILSKNQTVEEILSAIKSKSIDNYEINDRTVILK